MRTFLMVLSFVWVCVLRVSTGSAQTPTGAFSLKDGDRVLFVGNSLFENDVPFGYLEMALTTRWPGRNVTYRNIGWSGDNVFGESRSYITSPPTPYELLLQQITNAHPTVVFVAYGGIEAQAGEAGLPRFRQGLNKLLDTLDRLGAQTILLSPIPVLPPATQNLNQRNANLETYAAAIAQTAAERRKLYVDVYKPMLAAGRQAAITENGIHLTETGYYYLADALEKALGLPPRNPNISLAIAPNKANPNVQVVVNEPYLPLPVPKPDGKSVPIANGYTVTIKGLKKGFYTLMADGQEVHTASAKQWAEGAAVRQGPAFARAEKLQQLIRQKNELFFYQYRPWNRTYIIGFRSYEQGRHKKDLEELGFIITWLEGQIAATNQTQPVTYTLIPLN